MNPALRLVPGVLASLLAIPGMVRAQTAPDEPPWGRIHEMVRPQYPEAAIDRKVSGIVDVVGVVGHGDLAKVVYVPATPGAEIFLPEVRWIVPRWRVHGGRADCQPETETIRFRVEFAMDAEKARVFIVQAEGARASAIIESAQGEPVRIPEALQQERGRRTEPAYPREMVKANLEARVYARVRVDGMGHVTEVMARAYPLKAFAPEVRRMGSELPRRLEIAESESLRPFVVSVQTALQQWTFTKPPVPPPASWTGCYQITFELKP